MSCHVNDCLVCSSALQGASVLAFALIRLWMGVLPPPARLLEIMTEQPRRFATGGQLLDRFYQEGHVEKYNVEVVQASTPLTEVEVINNLLVRRCA